MTHHSLGCVRSAFGLAESRHGSANDLECQVWQAQNLCEAFQDALSIVVSVENPAQLVWKDEGLR